MTLFQWLTITPLALLFLAEIVALVRGRWSRIGLLRLSIWLAAALAIAYPDSTSQIAGRLGIQRGADLVLYVFVLAFLAVSFYFYARHVRVDRQLTELVRHLAIERAQAGKSADGARQATIQR